MNKPINELIKVMVDKAGGIYDFAVICKASPKTVRKWVNGTNPDSTHLYNALIHFGLFDVDKLKELLK